MSFSRAQSGRYFSFSTPMKSSRFHLAVSPQLWYARSGFGCEPHSSGRAVFATCLSDGETARWNREDFIGVLNEKYLPDWARDKIMELTAPRQEEPAAGEMKLE